jgi:hypothetical protein
MSGSVGFIKMISKKPLVEAIRLVDLKYDNQIEKNAIKRSMMVVRSDRKRGIQHTTASISQLYQGSLRAVRKYYANRGMLFDGNVYYNASSKLYR